MTRFILLLLLLTLAACSSQKQAHSVSQSAEVTERVESVSSSQVSDLSAILSCDRDVVLSGVSIIYHSAPDSLPDARAAPAATVSIDRIDIKDKKSADIKVHEELADSADVVEKTTVSNQSEEKVKAKTDVVRPPAVLIILAFSVVLGVLIFTLKQLHKSLPK